MIINIRPRRNRKTAIIRSLVEETTLQTSNFIFPLFVTFGNGIKVAIKSMPGIFRMSLDNIFREIEECMKLGINSFALFPHYEDNQKDKFATESINENGLYLSALRQIKLKFPQCCLMTDVAMDPYSSDGHDGFVEYGEIINDQSLEILGRMALAQAATGADMLGPSDMMDGRVGYIRNLLEKNNFNNTSIISYTAKYASAFYGPFRDALDSAPKSGDKKTYQMNPANSKEALLEAQLDTNEGADILMVKPAGAYLDIIFQLAQSSNLPIAAYQVSGEYAMIKAASQNGWLDNDRAMYESIMAIKRAGASIILTYFAKEMAMILQK